MSGQKLNPAPDWGDDVAPVVEGHLELLWSIFYRAAEWDGADLDAEDVDDCVTVYVARDEWLTDAEREKLREFEDEIRRVGDDLRRDGWSYERLTCLEIAFIETLAEGVRRRNQRGDDHR